MISFLRPAALVLFCIFPLFYFLRKHAIIQPLSFSLTLHNWNDTIIKTSSQMRGLSFLSKSLVFLSLIALIVAASEPVKLKTEYVYTETANSIMFVIDISPSMAAKDINEKTRIQAAKDIITDFVQTYPADAFGLTALASTAALVIPPTIQHEQFFARLNSLQIGELGEGTALGMGLAVAAAHFAKNTVKTQSIILLTDGESNTGEIHPNLAAELIKSKKIGFYIIGIGKDGYANLEYVDPSTGEKREGTLQTIFNERELRELAHRGNGIYVSAKSFASLQEIFKNISQNISPTPARFSEVKEVPLWQPLILFAVFSFILVWIIRRILMKAYL
ncbi:von Willebrand factor type A domain protein [Treponema phagedenis F0421]|uniref:VWA domain-containing protein n=1 Tax=Treponema phagedenis TaxID=162 RepID=UPI0001F63D0B|nr:VWA domain-containing protein [Treponema phagedenis]EFW37543.1 von Willebrand factor type A domain protein [Treponema phagedenis F0421]